ncbi:MAG: hypothetical protein IJM24_01880 [Clostridia bacterium]|nr:hypothetical protein [Clostridia bacterium]
MTKKNNRRKYILIFSLAALLVVAIAIGLSQAKYKTEKVMQGKVRFTATLAENLKIQEHPAVREHDGSYELNTDADPVQVQEYKLMPGVDIPKDPFVTVEGKTNIPGWLFVEIDDSKLPEEVTYAVRTEWIDTGRTGDYGGKLYVYNKALVTADTQQGTDDAIELTEFYVLAPDDRGNTITVSQYLARETDAKLNFYAYLCQAITEPATAEGESAPTDAAIAAAAKADYTTCFGATNQG